MAGKFRAFLEEGDQLKDHAVVHGSVGAEWAEFGVVQGPEYVFYIRGRSAECARRARALAAHLLAFAEQCDLASVWFEAE